MTPLRVEAGFVARMQSGEQPPLASWIPLHFIQATALKAREEAQVHGLTIKGTLGVIVRAYRTKLLRLDEVQTLVEAIIARDDVWIAEGLCRQVLAKLETEAV